MQALITTARVVDHPDPKVRGKIAHVAGREVFTNGTIDGARVLFIPEGAQLSLDFCLSQGLLAKHPETGEKLGGYLESSRRVKAIKLRGVCSEGIVIPLYELTSPASRGLVNLPPGTALPKTADDLVPIDTILFNGKPHQFIWKYETPATLLQRNANQGKTRRHITETNHFRRHYDTPQWRDNAKFIPQGAALYVTEKLHGTSARVGRVLSEQVQRRTVLQRLLGLIGLGPKPVVEYRYFNGTRNTVNFQSTEPVMPSGAGGAEYRREWFNLIAPQLRKGETVFFEIVGAGIQKGFDYGTVPHQTKAFIYRITMTNDDGIVTELSWQQVIGRAEQLKIPTVPTLRRYFVIDCARDIIDKRVKQLAAESSKVAGTTHIAEGVCVRYEAPNTIKSLKHKSFQFVEGENRAKDSDEFVDVEEAS